MINQELPRKDEIQLEVSIELGTVTFVTFRLPEYPSTQSEDYTVQGSIIVTKHIKLKLGAGHKDTLLCYLILKVLFESCSLLDVSY